MNSIRRIALAAALTVGCAAELKQYQPLAVQLTASRDARGAAVRELAILEGWRVVNTNAARGQLEAYSLEGQWSRERIVIDMHRAHVRIAVQTQLRDEAGRWMSSSTVCAEYAYAREERLARELERIINRGAYALR